jgi:hypothetical protein
MLGSELSRQEVIGMVRRLQVCSVGGGQRGRLNCGAGHRHLAGWGRLMRTSQGWEVREGVLCAVPSLGTLLFYFFAFFFFFFSLMEGTRFGAS